MRLQPSIEPSDDLVSDLDLSFIDDDPLNYFLTPAPSSQDSEMDLDLDLDAGISTPRHKKAPIVRSVSPSSLNSSLLTSLPLRPPTPPRSFGSRSPEPDLDMSPTPEDEEDESYLRFGSSPLTPPPFDMPFSLKDFAAIRSSKSAAAAAAGQKGKGKGKTGAAGATLLFPGGPPAQSSSASFSGRGRVSQRPGPRPLGALDARGRSRTWSGRMSPHAWREPSPDVWSIEEETEEDVVHSVTGDSAMEDRVGPVDIPGKVKKRVRFVLPLR
jgi:hypothetical protein